MAYKNEAYQRQQIESLQASCPLLKARLGEPFDGEYMVIGQLENGTGIICARSVSLTEATRQYRESYKKLAQAGLLGKKGQA